MNKYQNDKIYFYIATSVMKKIESIPYFPFQIQINLVRKERHDEIQTIQLL